jgi:hypothetical protein
MRSTATEPSALVHHLECQGGCRYIVYNAAAFGNPADHIADKWYVRAYPVPVGLTPDEAYDTADAAAQAARDGHNQLCTYRDLFPLTLVQSG